MKKMDYWIAVCDVDNRAGKRIEKRKSFRLDVLSTTVVQHMQTPVTFFNVQSFIKAAL